MTQQLSFNDISVMNDILSKIDIKDASTPLEKFNALVKCYNDNQKKDNGDVKYKIDYLQHRIDAIDCVLISKNKNLHERIDVLDKKLTEEMDDVRYKCDEIDRTSAAEIEDVRNICDIIDTDLTNEITRVRDDCATIDAKLMLMHQNRMRKLHAKVDQSPEIICYIHDYVREYVDAFQTGISKRFVRIEYAYAPLHTENLFKPSTSASEISNEKMVTSYYKQDTIVINKYVFEKLFKEMFNSNDYVYTFSNGSDIMFYNQFDAHMMYAKSISIVATRRHNDTFSTLLQAFDDAQTNLNYRQILSDISTHYLGYWHEYQKQFTPNLCTHVITYEAFFDKIDPKYDDYVKKVHAFVDKCEEYKKDDYKKFYEEFC